MICVSQGNSGKPCRHFQRGNCTYGNRCIHVHLVPAPTPQPGATPGEGEEDEDDEDEDDDEEDGENEDDGDPEKRAQKDKRAMAKRAAYEEALAAARAAAGKMGGGAPVGGANDQKPGPATGPDVGMAKTQMGAHAMMHGYSVGQKAKKKDPKPEEKRPGDWQCACGNYNFAWRKECNACGAKKPLNPMEEDAKKEELARIKAEREKRRAAARGDGDRDR